MTQIVGGSCIARRTWLLIYGANRNSYPQVMSGRVRNLQPGFWIASGWIIHAVEQKKHHFFTLVWGRLSKTDCMKLLACEFVLLDCIRLCCAVTHTQTQLFCCSDLIGPFPWQFPNHCLADVWYVNSVFKPNAEADFRGPCLLSSCNLTENWCKLCARYPAESPRSSRRLLTHQTLLNFQRKKNKYLQEFFVPVDSILLPSLRELFTLRPE